MYSLIRAIKMKEEIFGHISTVLAIRKEMMMMMMSIESIPP